MPKRPAKSTCPGNCAACRRSTTNGGNCPTWGEVEALRDEFGDMTTEQVGAAMGIGRRCATHEVRRLASRLAMSMGKAVGPQDGTPFRGSDLFCHARSVWDGEDEAA